VADCEKRTGGVVHGITRDRLQAELGGAELRESELGRLTDTRPPRRKSCSYAEASTLGYASLCA
jgi:hypothetical protein